MKSSYDAKISCETDRGLNRGIWALCRKLHKSLKQEAFVLETESERSGQGVFPFSHLVSHHWIDTDSHRITERN